MSEPQTNTGDPFAEFGGAAVTPASAPPNTAPASDPFAEFGGTAVTQAQPTAPHTIASDASKIPNARIRNLPNPAEGLTPTQALISGAGAGTALAAIPASPALGDALPAAINFARSEPGKDLMKLVLKHTGEKLLTGAGVGVGYEIIHQAAKLLGLD